MGDRANIYVVDEAPDRTGLARGFYLYSHWGGTELPERLRVALGSSSARLRWFDSPYLVRILVHALFENDRGGDTGSGISTYRTDNEHQIIVLDTVGEVVAFAKPGYEVHADLWYAKQTFKEYVDQTAAVYPDEKN